MIFEDAGVRDGWTGEEDDYGEEDDHRAEHNGEVGKAGTVAPREGGVCSGRAAPV
ncbi:hypothetical protein ACWDYJ_33150 [Streptomyces sp. NPDC003042]